MRTNSKNGLNKPNDVIVFDIPEASVTDRGRAKKLRYLKRAKGVRHVGSVPSYWDGGKLVICFLALIGKFFEKSPHLLRTNTCRKANFLWTG